MRQISMPVRNNKQRPVQTQIENRRNRSPLKKEVEKRRKQKDTHEEDKKTELLDFPSVIGRLFIIFA